METSREKNLKEPKEKKPCGVKVLSTSEPSWEFIIKDRKSLVDFVKKLLKAWRCAKKDEDKLRIHVNQGDFF